MGHWCIFFYGGTTLRREFLNRGLNFLFLSALLNSPAALAQEDPLRSAVTRVQFKYGIEIIEKADSDISNRFHRHNSMMFRNINYSPAISMVEMVEQALDRLPSPGLMAQKIIFFPPFINADLLAEYHRGPALGEDGWVTFFTSPGIFSVEGLEAANPDTIGNFDIPNMSFMFQHLVVHEFGHGLDDEILYLSNSEQAIHQANRMKRRLDPENPVYRTFSKVAGFEFVNPEGSRMTLDPRDVNGEERTMQSNGWVRKNQYVQQQPQISRYEQFSAINEVFAEYFRAAIFAPDLLDENQATYFKNLFFGLNSDDPEGFLRVVALEPEKVLLKGVRI